MKFINNGLKNINNLKKIIKENPILYDRNFYSGIELGIPLSIFEYTFTFNHLGTNIVNFQDVCLLSLIGYVTYGCDRFLDSIEYYKNNQEIEVGDRKKELYTFLNENKYDVMRALFISYFLLNLYFFKNEKILYFLPFMYSAFYYKQIKLNIPCFKPLFVACLWTTASVIIPSIVYENNYNIIQDVYSYAPAYFSLLGLSNYLDIKDIDEDKDYGYLTIPNVLGLKNARFISVLSLLFSTLLYTKNEHFGERYFIDFFFVIQNLSLIVPILTKQKN